MLAALSNFLMPVGADERPANFYRFSRLVLGLTLLALPMLYDRAVPEVAGDPRWGLLQLVVGFLLALMLLKDGFKGTLRPRLADMPLALPIVGLLAAWVCLTFTWTVSPWDGINDTLNFLAYFGLFFLVYRLRNAGWYMNLLVLLMPALAFNGLLGILQFHNIRDADIGWGLTFIDLFAQAAPPAATFANKNITASYLVMMLPLALALSLITKERWVRTLSLVAFTLGSILLVYTRSRGSWVAAAFAVVCLAVWLAADRNARATVCGFANRSYLLALGAALAVVVVASFFQSPLRGFHSVDKTVGDQLKSIGNLSPEGDLGVRYAYYRNAMTMIQDKPLGFGVGSYRNAFPYYHNKPMPTPRAGFAIDARPQRLHNDVLQMFVETGIPGGVAYLTLFALFLTYGWRVARHGASAEQRLLALAACATLLGLGINVLGDFPLQLPTAPALLWTVAAMLTALSLGAKAPVSVAAGKPLRAAAVAMGVVCTALTAYAVDRNGPYFLNGTERQANAYLKVAIALTMQGIYDERAKAYVDEAYRLSPTNVRGLEYRAVIYTNYTAKPPISVDTRIAVNLEALETDPYGPNHLVNLGGLYNTKASEMLSYGANREDALVYADKALEVSNRLMAVADFAPHGFTIAGFAYLLKGNNTLAESNFMAALARQPGYGPAMSGLQQIVEQGS
jgi:O-antigen ligase